MKRILILAAMLSILLCGFGTAHAIRGVDDNVPGTDLVIPVVCEVAGGLNTNYAIAETFTNPNFDSTSYLLHFILLNDHSLPVNDWTDTLTGFDINVSNFCANVADHVIPANLGMLKRTIGGRDYYVGYLVVIQPDVSEEFNHLVSWAYLVDLQRGFTSGFNPFDVEGAVSEDLDELDSDPNIGTGNFVPVDAHEFYPRYFFLNNKAESFNWWIFLAGTNNSSRVLSGYICDEQENCDSLNVPIPIELNIVDVMQFIPNRFKTINNFPTDPLGGFAVLSVLPYAERADDITGGIAPVTIMGWSYQRAQGNSLATSWAAMHPVHRDAYLCATSNLLFGDLSGCEEFPE